MSQLCNDCGARCCRYFCFEIDRPTSFEEFENARWFLMHEGVAIHIDVEGDWYIAIANRCRNLLPNNRCKQYARRPLICRRYNLDGCDYTQGQYEYRALFTTPEQLENYARMKLGPKRYDRIRKNTFAKAEARAAKAEKGAKGAKKSSATVTAGTPPAAARRNRKKRQEPTTQEVLMNLFA